MSENTSEESQKKVNNLWLRRLANVVISLLIGYAGTYLSVHLILQTVMADYGSVYIFFTVGSIACAVGIWLDHERLLNSQFLPH